MRKAVTILPRLISFASPVTRRLDEVDDRIGRKSSVWTPRSRLSERQSDRGRDRADPIWIVAPIRDQLGDVLADAPLDLADLGQDMLVRRLVDMHAEVDLVDVDERVAKRAGHRRVDLRDDRLGGVDGATGPHRRWCRASSSHGRRAGSR